MDLVLTVVDRRSARRAVDVLVRAEPGTTFGAVRGALLAAAGCAPAAVFCGPRALGDDAVVGRPPLLHGAVLSVGEADPAEPSALLGLLELHVRSGPDAGGMHRLRPGDHTIGRSPAARVTVDDPDVSRLHAMVRVGVCGTGETTVHDLGSTNGTTVDGTTAGRDGLAVHPGQVLQVGSTRLELVLPQAVPVSTRPDGLGRVEVNRPPRRLPAHDPVRVRLPSPPPVTEATRLSWPAVALPLVAGLAMLLVTRSTTFLLLALLSPLMMLGSTLNDRWGVRRQDARCRQEYAQRRDLARRRVHEALRDERRRRHDASPDLATLLACVQGPRPRLWERRPYDEDFLDLRLGLGQVPADVEVHEPARGAGGDGGMEVTRPLLADVPVTVSLRHAGVLGLAGPRDRVLALARSLLAQLTGWHSPHDLALDLLSSRGGGDWEWARWLPHLQAGAGGALRVGLTPDQVARRIGELEALLNEHTRRPHTGGPPGPVCVVVLDGAEELRRLPGVARLLREGRDAGIHIMCLDDDLVSLPVECAATVCVDGETPSLIRVVDHLGHRHDDVVMDGLGVHGARVFARAMGAFRDATPDLRGGAVPDEARLVEVAGRAGMACGDPPDPEWLASSWAARPRGTRVPLGVAEGGEPVFVDLATDGPHVLVAGTTGSGKSELLQSLVAGLAMVNRPDALALVLVDYKGGAAFGECANLPHTAGLVTDLDHHLTQRALESLSAELRRREELLRQAGCPDLDRYLETVDAAAGRVTLPRLVIVVDEFATLAEELPDFVGGLVGIAARGRSLGVHLVLATQRPGSSVSADIRANTGLRIALRVTDPVESRDVVDIPDAAAISRSTPGRAVFRTGTGRTRLVQTARVTGRAGTPGPLARAVPWEPAADPAPPPTEESVDEPSDLSLLVQAARSASAALGVRPPPGPWLPPLPSLLHLEQLGPSTPDALAVGLVDLPRAARQEALVVDLSADEHLLVCGGPRSGRTTLLRTVAAGVATHLERTDAHLYVLDGAGGLGVLAQLPHCGAVVGADDPERAARLLRRLGDECRRRTAALARAGVGSLAEQRVRTPPGDRLPWIVLLVDGWDLAPELPEQAALLDDLALLVRDGGAAGVRVVLAGDRSLLTSRLGSGFTRRLVLPLADPGDYALAGIPARRVPPRMPPGRALLVPEGHEAQVAVVGARPGAAEQIEALHQLAQARRSRNQRSAGAGPCSRQQVPLRVDPLPGRVPLPDLLVAAKEVSTGPGWLLAGLGGDELRPLGVDLDLDGPGFTVAGPPGSGRSTTLLAMARWLLAAGRVVGVIANPRSPLRRLAGEPGVVVCSGPGEPAALAAALAEHPGLVVLVDDAETVHDSAVEPLLLARLRPDHADAGHVGHLGGVVVAGSAAEQSTCFRGLTVESRRSRTGLLLGPLGPGESDLLGVRGWRGRAGRPGRGLLVVRGHGTPVQVPDST